jgi:hypothetical protein
VDVSTIGSGVLPRCFSGAHGKRGKSVKLAREVLENGRELVAQGWSQGAEARDSDQNAVHPWSSEARSWSVLGAIVCGDETRRGRVPIDQLATAAILLAHSVDTPSLSKWNDQPGRTQAEALAAFDAALASAAERPESQVRDSSG